MLSRETLHFACLALNESLSGYMRHPGMRRARNELAAFLTYGPRPWSRREQRRAKKAAKNAYMWRTCGERPWNRRHQHETWGLDLYVWDALDFPEYIYLEGYGECHKSSEDLTATRRPHLRERSGFLDMSRRADEAAFLRDHLAEFNRLSMSTLFDEATP